VTELVCQKRAIRYQKLDIHDSVVERLMEIGHPIAEWEAILEGHPGCPVFGKSNASK
jgi:hypothetical protein